LEAGTVEKILKALGRQMVHCDANWIDVLYVWNAEKILKARTPIGAFWRSLCRGFRWTTFIYWEHFEIKDAKLCITTQ